VEQRPSRRAGKKSGVEDDEDDEECVVLTREAHTAAIQKRLAESGVLACADRLASEGTVSAHGFGLALVGGMKR
jgi:hypothetical protein